MVQGTSSWAGKSLVSTALARALHRRGIRVAPFKAQNMSNNARVARGGEIGAAQYLQALAADVQPEVRMNPVLVKPESDARSQVVVLGEVDHELSAMHWRERAPRLRSVIDSSLRELLSEHELLVIEGAGSPAEINLCDIDLANMHVARLARAAVVLVADIDRGGAFAHLYGTWALMEAADRERLAGFLLNKFRGDPALLDPAPAQLQELTGVPTLGVLPWLEHALPDEDGAAAPAAGSAGRQTVAVARYPTASNLDELKALEQVTAVRWATSPEHLDDAELVVLPGSKHVAADLRWLEQSGLAAALMRRVDQGGAVLGICGGMQMLGQDIGAEGAGEGSAQGLGLLPISTCFAPHKRLRRGTVRFGELPEPWSALSGLAFEGYEIRQGSSAPTRALAAAICDGLGYVAGPVLGIYAHGLFEQPEVLEALFGRRPPQALEATFDALADALEAHVDVEALLRASAAAGAPAGVR